VSEWEQAKGLVPKAGGSQVKALHRGIHNLAINPPILFECSGAADSFANKLSGTHGATHAWGTPGQVGHPSFLVSRGLTKVEAQDEFGLSERKQTQ